MNCTKPIEPTRVSFRLVDNRRKPKTADYTERAATLHERLDSSWFRSEWRKNIDDGCRSDAMEKRTWRGIRLFSFWWFAAKAPQKKAKPNA